jgi:hypothetical protein
MDPRDVYSDKIRTVQLDLETDLDRISCTNTIYGLVIPFLYFKLDKSSFLSIGKKYNGCLEGYALGPNGTNLVLDGNNL